MSKLHKKNKPLSEKETQLAKKKMGAYAKYSSMAIQMGVIITGGSLGGMKLDQYLESNYPFFTLGFSILSVVIAVYLAIKDIINYNS